MTAPLHSVIMPVLNGSEHVLQGIASALAELGPDDELIVIDNGSTDGTSDLVRSIGDPRIVLLFEPKRGPAAARNLGLRQVHGSFVSFHDHDDLWPPGRLSAMLTTLMASPGSNAVYGRLQVQFDGPADRNYMGVDGKAIRQLGVIAYLMTAEVARRVEMDESLPAGEDTDYLLRLFESGMVAVEHDGVVVIYRRHGTNMTHDWGKVRSANLSVLARNIARRRAQEQSK